MEIRVKRSHTYEVRPGVSRTLPTGWAGSVNDDVGQSAVDAGNAVRTDVPAQPNGGGVLAGPFEIREKAPGWWAIYDGKGEPVGKAVRKSELEGFDTLSDDDKLDFATEHAKAAA